MLDFDVVSPFIIKCEEENGLELQTITQVSRQWEISTRTLRYYEQIGLLQSLRVEGYAYRMYDEEALRRLEIIRLLRKLRIPLKRIADILEDPRRRIAAEVFRQEIGSLEGEIDALTTIRDILLRLVDAMRADPAPQLEAALLSDAALRSAISAIAPELLQKREDNTMEELNQATNTLNKLTDVRIVYLPPATVACSHYIGEEPEQHAGDKLNEFVQSVKLWELKPDARLFGFNHPSPTEERPVYGYEVQITIPEDLPVPEPLIKRAFAGGLFAAHTITMGNFQEWEWLYRYVQESEHLELNMTEDGGERMFGSMEEPLNYLYYQQIGGMPEGLEAQLDLLLPIKMAKRAR